MYFKSFLRALVILLVPTIGATATTIHVPGDYSTIQGGLSAAQYGDTVLVAPGTYIENLYWPNTQGIKLLSEQGAGSTIIDGGNTNKVIRFNWVVDNLTVIDGFTIQNGIAYPTQGGGWADAFGGGISLDNGASPIIRNNIIQNCTATIDGMGSGGGGGIGTIGSSPTGVRIEENIIQDNTVTCECLRTPAFGGGIYIRDAEDVFILGNEIVDNGIDSIISISFGYGGGLFIRTGTVTITGNEFISNTALAGAGMYLGYDSPGIVATVSECLFEGNTFSIQPETCSCIMSAVGSISITNSSIENNIALGYLIWGGTVTIDSCTISGNLYGGIKQDASSNTFIYYSNIFDNNGYGVNNLTSTAIDATYCWWGDASGPGGEGPGTGDEVSANVLYDPWLTEMGVETADPGSQMELHVFPNPFSSNVAVSFELPNIGLVAIQVFDLSGRIVEEATDDLFEAGSHTIQLDGSGWSPGIYLIHLNTANSTVTQRCVLVR